jgi:hypothetical protein
MKSENMKSISEIAKILNLTYMQVYHQVKKINPSLKMSRRKYYDIEDYKKYLLRLNIKLARH